LSFHVELEQVLDDAANGDAVECGFGFDLSPEVLGDVADGDLSELGGVVIRRHGEEYAEGIASMSSTAVEAQPLSTDRTI
jgi:sorbitol-specific phosphotransferase system component IIA